MPANEDLLYLFVHIPKTGGQTLRNHFIDHLPFHERFIHLGPFGYEDAEKRGLKPFAQRPAAERAKAQVILGHGVNCQTASLVPEKQPRHVVFLRDPAERMISHYNFAMEYEYRLQGKATVSFDQWYGVYGRQTSVHWICREFLMRDVSALDEEEQLHIAIATLEDFWFVGTMDKFWADSAAVLREMGLPPLAVDQRSNVTGIDFERTVELSASLREAIHDRSSADLALYRHFSVSQSKCPNRRKDGPA